MTKRIVLIALGVVLSGSVLITRGAQAGFSDRMQVDPLAKPTFPATATSPVPGVAKDEVERAQARPAARTERRTASRLRQERQHHGQTGLATWYGPGFNGHRTASGERFSGNAMTAAHRSLPFWTRVRVVNQKTGRSVVVRINDRGPYRRGAIIDLSRASARALGVSGTARVTLVSLSE